MLGYVVSTHDILIQLSMGLIWKTVARGWRSGGGECQIATHGSHWLALEIEAEHEKLDDPTDYGA